jgi:hypothetical protein
MGVKSCLLHLREEYSLRVYENRVLRRTFWAKKEQVTGRWRKVNNEALHNLCSSPKIIRVMKSRRMRWVGHAARMKDEKCVQNFSRKPEGKRRDISENLGIVRRIILTWILKKEDMKMWTGVIWLRIETRGGVL